MFNDADTTLRELLVADVPIDRSEVDITFERPTREWSSRISKPTLNLFLFDIRERLDFRDDEWKVQRDPNGRAIRVRGPRRVDLAYSVTAWTKEPEDEHRILGRVLATMYRTVDLPSSVLQGQLANATVPVYARCMPPDYLAKPADFWGVMDNEMHASLTWVATVPLDVFAPVEGPLTTSRVFGYGEIGRPERELFIRVGGFAHRKGDPDDRVPFTRVQVVGTGFSAMADESGMFVFSRVPEGDQTWLVEPPGQEAFELPMTVPSPLYNVEIGPKS